MSKTTRPGLECQVPSDRTAAGEFCGDRTAAGEFCGDRKRPARTSADRENVRLRRRIAELERENVDLGKRVSALECQLAEFLRLHCGGKTDQLEGDGEGSPDAGDIPTFELGGEGPSAGGDRPPSGRLAGFPGHSDSEVRALGPPGCCPKCGSEDWTPVHVDEMETLDVKPVAHCRLVTRRQKAECAPCGKIRQAPAPRRLFPGGCPGDNLVADMVADHVFMAMPITCSCAKCMRAAILSKPP